MMLSQLTFKGLHLLIMITSTITTYYDIISSLIMTDLRQSPSQFNTRLACMKFTKDGLYIQDYKWYIYYPK